MIWLTWRQFRWPLLTGLILLAADAVILAVVGHAIYADIQQLQQPICIQFDGCNQYYGDLASQYMNLHTYSAALIALPTLIGIFIGVPLVTSEFEQRTYQMIWTQGVPRGRWLALQLMTLFALVLVATGVVTWLVSWGEQGHFFPTAGFTNQNGERFTLFGYDLSGTVPLAYAAFGLALGLLGGTLLRRTLPAVGLTLAGFLAVRIPVAVLWRPYFLPPITKIYSLIQDGPSTITSSPYDWWLEQGFYQHGQYIKGAIQVPSDCPINGQTEQCMAAHGISQYVIYQPYERFWTFQAIETVLFGLLAAGLVWLTFAVVLRRP